MSKNFYCTYFDSNFIHSGLSLLQSLIQYDSNCFIFVLCLDSETFISLQNFDKDKIKLLTLKEFENSYKELQTAKGNRSITEYYWTLTPYLIFNLLVIRKVSKTITYLDADQFFYSNPNVIFDEIGKNEIAIMPHRYQKFNNSAKEHGEFNVSWVTFKNTKNSIDCLKWWKASCLNWCYAAGDKKRYGDQKYLDEFPKRYKNVHIIENIGCGVAPWNLGSFNYNTPLILFHFQSFRLRSQNILTAVIPKFEKCNLKKFKKYILIPYFKSLQKNIVKKNHNSKNFSDKSFMHNEGQVIFIKFCSQIIQLHGKKMNIYLLLFTKARSSMVKKGFLKVIKKLKITKT